MQSETEELTPLQEQEQKTNSYNLDSQAVRELLSMEAWRVIKAQLYSRISQQQELLVEADSQQKLFRAQGAYKALQGFNNQLADMYKHAEELNNE